MSSSWKNLVLFTTLTCAIAACGGDTPQMHTPQTPSKDVDGHEMGRHPHEEDEDDVPVRSGTATLQVVNKDSSFTLAGLYVAYADDDEWGDNFLDGKTLSAGQSGTLTGVPCEESLKVALISTRKEVRQNDDVVFPCDKVTTLTIAP